MDRAVITAQPFQAVEHRRTFEQILLQVEAAIVDGRLQPGDKRLAADMTSGRRDDLREAASSAAGEGVGVEDVTVVNDRPIGIVAREAMTWLGWH